MYVTKCVAGMDAQAHIFIIVNTVSHQQTNSRTLHTHTNMRAPVGFLEQ